MVFIYGSIFYEVAHSLDVESPKKKNMIFMVSDGMGPASLALARSFKQYRDHLTFDDILTLDRHLIGSSRTRSSSSLITDSAAGATAFSCALKSYNSAIGVDPHHQPCGTVLEALKLQGYLTGLVVTTRITDATPAAFSAHTDYRFQEDLIAEQQLGEYPLGRMVDLIIGGGRCHYHPSSEGGCRSDGRNLIEQAQKDGWSYLGDRLAFDALQGGENVTLPLLSLLAEGDIPFDLDRDESVYPSLEEQTRTALKALSKATEDSDKGFFLLVEGSRIDHAGHENDPAAQVREVLAYDKAFEAVLEFANNSSDDTVIISTSDHETGGLATARQISPSYPDYIWYPELLLNAKHSGEFLAKKLAQYKGSDVKDFIAKEILEKDLGIHDYTQEDVENILTGSTQDVCNNLVSLRSQTGWSTHGHSQVDVNIYAYANSEELMVKLYKKLSGNHENTEIGAFMADWLNADLGKVTELVKDTKHSDSFLKEHFANEQVVMEILEEEDEADEYHNHLVADPEDLE